MVRILGSGSKRVSSRNRGFFPTEFVEAVRSGTPLVKQMLMGGGKSTVVGPLLSLLLGDGHTLVVQLMPPALLEQSKATLRATKLEDLPLVPPRRRPLPSWIGDPRYFNPYGRHTIIVPRANATAARSAAPPKAAPRAASG